MIDSSIILVHNALDREYVLAKCTVHTAPKRLRNVQYEKQNSAHCSAKKKIHCRHSSVSTEIYINCKAKIVVHTAAWRFFSFHKYLTIPLAWLTSYERYGNTECKLTKANPISGKWKYIRIRLQQFSLASRIYWMHAQRTQRKEPSWAWAKEDGIKLISYFCFVIFCHLVLCLLCPERHNSKESRIDSIN